MGTAKESNANLSTSQAKIQPFEKSALLSFQAIPCFCSLSKSLSVKALTDLTRGHLHSTHNI